MQHRKSLVGTHAYCNANNVLYRMRDPNPSFKYPPIFHRQKRHALTLKTRLALPNAAGALGDFDQFVARLPSAGLADGGNHFLAFLALRLYAFMRSLRPSADVCDAALLYLNFLSVNLNASFVSIWSLPP